MNNSFSFTVHNDMKLIFHCVMCIEEKPNDVSAQEYARIQTGVTADGQIQVWCNRHDANIIKIKPEDIERLSHMRCERDGCPNGNSKGVGA